MTEVSKPRSSTVAQAGPGWIVQVHDLPLDRPQRHAGGLGNAGDPARPHAAGYHHMVSQHLLATGKL